MVKKMKKSSAAKPKSVKKIAQKAPLKAKTGAKVSAAPKAAPQKESFWKKLLKKCFFFVDMKRRYKVLSFFALLFVVAYCVTPSPECVVKRLVHQYGSQFLGTDVSIQGFELSPFSGKASVKGLRIANPQGYQSADLFNLNEISVDLDVKSLFSDTIVVRSINISKPAFTYEMLSFTKNNVSDLMDNIQANTASSANEPTEQKAEEKSAAKSEGGKKVIIRSLIVDQGEVSVMAGFANMKKALTLPLPSIKLANIGEDKKGASIPDTIKTVLNEVLNAVSQTAFQAVGNVQDLGKASLDQVKNSADEIKNQAEETTKGLTGAFKGLFN